VVLWALPETDVFDTVNWALPDVGSNAFTRQEFIRFSAELFLKLRLHSRRSALLRITGALVGMGIPEYEAKRYEGRVKEGSILLSVHCDDSKWTKKAKEILERTGAEDVSSTGEAGADFSKTDKPMQRAS
jgi:hypothetical protein